VTGRKRNVALDSPNLIGPWVVRGTYWQEHDGTAFALFRLRQQVCRPVVVFADSACARNEMVEWVRENFHWTLKIVLRPRGAKHFAVLQSGELSSGPSPGSRATAATPGTMNASPRQ
jgi:hypothetical protein